ncbi:MAG: 50S ribosomal protein L18 [Thermoprotei archaeon]|nr:MAG: 50S ribosomal protein L18 [Thermoprotei archaeon]
MARGARYKVPFKRRRKGLTNYRKRKALVISGKPRLIVRKSNRHITAQIAEAEPQGDLILVSTHSRELVRDYGWKGYTCNTPAAYLLGLIIGYKALKRDIREAILDIGLHRSTKGNVVYAVVKGAIDAGLKIPVGEDMLPSENRIKGEHIAEYAKILKEENPEQYQRQFSSYLKRKLPPESIPEHFENVKESIIKRFSS